MERSHCLYGFFSLLCGGPGLLARGATLLAAAGVLYFLIRLLWQPLSPGTGRLAVQFSGLVIGTVLLSPHFLTYDLTILLLPMFLLLVTILRPGLPLPAVSRGLLAGLALFYVLAGVSVRLAAVTHLQLTVPALVVGLAFLATHGQTELARESHATD